MSLWGMRTPKSSPAKTPRTAMRTRKKVKKAAPEMHVTSDHKPVQEPRDGYPHAGNLDNPFPSPDEIKSMDLSAHYEPGHVPAAVSYGRRQVVLAQMIAAVPTFEIVRSCGARYGMSASMTKFFVGEIRAAWRNDVEEQRSYAGVEVVTRLRRDLANMRAEKKKPWQAIRAHETLLSRIEGTLTPIKVNVYDANEVMRDAVAGVLGSMTEEDMLEFVTDGEEVFDDTNQLPAAE